MTPLDSFDRQLQEFLAETAPRVAPDGLHERAMTRVRRSRQRSSWSAATRAVLTGTAGRSATGVIRFASIVGLASGAALIAVVLAVGAGDAPGPLPTAPPPPASTASPDPGATPAPARTASPAPTVTAQPASAPAGVSLPPTVPPVALADGFVRPFVFAMPADGAARRFDMSDPRDVFGFVEGPVTAVGDHRYGSLQSNGGVRGLVVASLEGAVTHACPRANGGAASRVAIRTDPSTFLEDLHTIAGVGFGTTAPSTLDGLPGLSVRVNVTASRCTFADFHPGAGGDFIALTMPSQLTIVEVDGVTVVVDIWARTEAELSAWLPSANAIVESIHFVKQP